MTGSQRRLVGACAAALMLIAALGIVGWTQLKATSDAYGQLVDHDARLTKDALEMKVAVNEQAAGLRGYLLTKGDHEFLAPYEHGAATFADELRQADAKAANVDESSRLDEIERLHAALRPIYARKLALAREGRFNAAIRASGDQGRTRNDALVTALDGLVSSEAEALYQRRATVGTLARSAQIAILGVLALALVVGIVAATLALRAARRGAGAMAETDSARSAAAEAGALARIATAIAHEVEPRAVLASAAKEAAGLLGAASAAILRFEPGQRSALVVGATKHGGVARGGRVPVESRDVLGRCLADPAAASAAGALDVGPQASPLKPAGAGAELAVPIRVGAHAWGAIWVAAAAGAALPQQAAARLVRFAELASASITSADARAHLAQLAHEDSVTGLANHRSFHERLRAEVARARRHRRELSVVLFDVDHFKDVNDVHGHRVGDRVLRETADRLAGCARSGELVARLGGEEFGWILPEAGALDAYQAAERARRILSSTPMADGVHVTMSAGVCDLEHASSGTELMRYADGALFWAKAHGRNITFRYSPEVVTELSADEQLEHLRRTRTIVGIRALARAVDVKDPSTARHSERVAEISTAIARALGWDDQQVAALQEAALVHDVGKIGVPDAILLKPARLDPDEYEAIKQHATLSAQIVSDVLTDEQVSWVLGHHERFDGRGYPQGLADGQIPLGARLLAVADAWDVMISRRPYSAARGKHDALAEARAEAGRQFCPEAVKGLERAIAANGLVDLTAEPSGA